MLWPDSSYRKKNPHPCRLQSIGHLFENEVLHLEGERRQLISVRRVVVVIVFRLVDFHGKVIVREDEANAFEAVEAFLASVLAQPKIKIVLHYVCRMHL